MLIIDVFSSKKRFIKFILSSILILLWSSSILAQELTTPQGVRLLQNKSFDDSDWARQEILDLYKDLRLTDVMDGMDLIGLQDIGLMDKIIRPLWRDVENFTHRIVGFAITVRHVPTDVRVGQNSFPDLEGFKKFKEEQYKRAPDALKNIARPGDVAVIDAIRYNKLRRTHEILDWFISFNFDFCELQSAKNRYNGRQSKGYTH